MLADREEPSASEDTHMGGGELTGVVEADLDLRSLGADSIPWPDG